MPGQQERHTGKPSHARAMILVLTLRMPRAVRHGRSSSHWGSMAVVAQKYR
jgi:hypothetical protein